MSYVAAIFAALWKLLAPLFAPVAAAGVGAELERGAEAQSGLKQVDEANAAASAVDADRDGMRDKWK